MTRRTQLALLTLKNSRQSLFVPELLVPDGWSTATLNQPRTLYKVVAAVDGRLVSIYDSVTQYKLGQTLHAREGSDSVQIVVTPILSGLMHPRTYFLAIVRLILLRKRYFMLQQAASAVFPRNSQLAKAARMLIEHSNRGQADLSFDSGVAEDKRCND
ncbi:MAG: hypothetical protein FRX49_11264 [Trebouxia sp. A1-2]|nr:MAG: hypothetical protein FRX49_11264 [Trebouxia sp. A1-2]